MQQVSGPSPCIPSIPFQELEYERKDDEWILLNELMNEEAITKHDVRKLGEVVQGIASKIFVLEKLGANRPIDNATELLLIRSILRELIHEKRYDEGIQLAKLLRTDELKLWAFAKITFCLYTDNLYDKMLEIEKEFKRLVSEKAFHLICPKCRIVNQLDLDQATTQAIISFVVIKSMQVRSVHPLEILDKDYPTESLSINDNDKDNLFKRLMACCIQRDDFDLAIQIAENISSVDTKVLALLCLADNLILKRHFDRTEQIIEKLSTLPPTHYSLTGEQAGWIIILNMAEAGEHERAWKLAQQKDPPEWDLTMLKAIIAKGKLETNLEEACALTREILSCLKHKPPRPPYSTDLIPLLLYVHPHHPKPYNKLYEIGLYLIRANKIDLAKEIFERCVAPKLGKYWYSNFEKLYAQFIEAFEQAGETEYASMWKKKFAQIGEG